MPKTTFELSIFEAVKVRNQLYGKKIIFNHEKKYIQFSSDFHPSDFVQYDEIKTLVIEYNNRSKLKMWGLILLIAGIGILILMIRAWTPPWLIQIKFKKNKPPIKIQARLHDWQPSALADFCTPKIPTVLLLPEKKIHTKKI